MQSVRDGTVAPAGTYNASPVGLAASLALIDQLEARREELYPALDRAGLSLATLIGRVAARYEVLLWVNQVGSMLQLGWGLSAVSTPEELSSSDHVTTGLICEAAALFGAYIHPRGTLLVSAAHDDADIEALAFAVERAVELVLDLSRSAVM